jgi:hypothetical protein
MPDANDNVSSQPRRFAEWAKKGLRLERCVDADGAPAPLEITRLAPAFPDGAAEGQATAGRIGWKRRAVQWALAGSVATGLALAIAASGPNDSLDKMQFEGAALAQTTPDAAQQAPDASFNAVLGAARAEWIWARDQGFYRADHIPRIGDLKLHVGGDEGIACAVYEMARGSMFRSPKLLSDIQITPQVSAIGISSDVPTEDIEQIILHEGYHAEAFMTPGMNKLDGSLLRGDAADLFKAVVWADSMLSYADHEANATHKADRDALAYASANPSQMYEEASADSFSFIVLAHKLPAEEWAKRLMRAEGMRAYSMIAGSAFSDPHETQESLQILASIGHDKLAALTPDQSRALADAVAADGVALAAAKQGWASKIPSLSTAAQDALSWGPEVWGAGKLAEMHTLMHEKSFAELEPAAQRWRGLPDAQKQAAFDALAQQMKAWETGATLDYSAISPGLAATVAPHAAGPSYEAVATPSDAKAIAGKIKGGLAEWKQTAQSMGETSAAMGQSKVFDWMASQLPKADRQELAKDAFWAPEMAGFDGRLATLRAQQAATQKAQALAQAGAQATASAEVSTASQPRM